LLASAPAAFASGKAAPAGTTTGACSAASTWTLKLKLDNGRIESDVEVDSPAAGQVWTFVMKDNGVKFASGSRTTGAGGSFSVTKFATNQAGTDKITVNSKNTVTGEVCRASGSL
jgi:hypothetical protein